LVAAEKERGISAEGQQGFPGQGILTDAVLARQVSGTRLSCVPWLLPAGSQLKCSMELSKAFVLAWPAAGGPSTLFCLWQ
jgi:hypothetical protein